MSSGQSITGLSVSAYQVPTDFPEADGTLQWNSTTLVWVELQAGGLTGVGYTYASAAAAWYIEQHLKPLVLGQDAIHIPAIWQLMLTNIRNDGTTGITCAAISAVDNALWDLKAKMLNKPLALLLGMVKPGMQVYGSGGFTSYPNNRLQQQLAGWVANGFTAVKMKIGRHPETDTARITAARQAIGSATLMVDANGAYDVATAIEKAAQFAGEGITWFEEPVSADNLAGLEQVRQKTPCGIRVVAGEYGFMPYYFLNMLNQRAVDVLQADATRCCGITGFIKAAHLTEAFQLPLSPHCAPSVHLHVAPAFNHFYIAEYFHDHARIETMLFDGCRQPVNGMLTPNLSLPGLGIQLKHTDAKPYRIL